MKPQVDGSAVGTLTETITLTAGEVAADKSSFTAVPTTIVADNSAASTLTFTAKDANDNPVTGLTTVIFKVTGVTGTTVSSVSETNGVYTATLTGISAGSVTVKPQVDGSAVGTLTETITLTAGEVDADKSTFTAAPTTIVADNSAASTLTFIAKDANDNPVTGLTAVIFEVTGVTGTTVSTVSETNGMYTATLTGITAGSAKVKPQVNGSVVGSFSETITLTAGEVDEAKSSFTAAPDNIASDNSEASTLTFTAKDANDNPVTGLTPIFAVTGVTGTTVSSVSEISGVYTATLTGSTAGTATIKPQVTGNIVGNLSAEVELISAPAPFSHILVNGATFDVDSSFPKTAFAGAKFQMEADGNVANNSNYNWSVSDNSVSITSGGVVTINTKLIGKEATITAISKTNPTKQLNYKFTIAYWYTNEGSKTVTALANGCSSGSPTNHLSKLNNEGVIVRSTDSIGLWNGWGNMSIYGFGWLASRYWGLASGHDDSYVIDLGSGAITEALQIGGDRFYVACVHE